MHLSYFYRKPAVTIPAGGTLAAAAELMDHKAVGAVVVVDDDDRPLGIVTDRDIAVRGMARRLPPDARIDAVMSTELVTLPADADLAEAVAAFDRYAHRRIPLVENGRIVGMVTVDDLVVGAVADLTRLLRPVLDQVLFGHPEAKVPVPTT